MKTLAKTALIAGAVSLALSGCGYFEKFFIPECNFVKTIEFITRERGREIIIKEPINVRLSSFSGVNFQKIDEDYRTNYRANPNSGKLEFTNLEGKRCYLSRNKIYNEN